MKDLKYDTNTGLIPAIIQDANTSKVLMLGYMNPEALQNTIHTKLITFYSRSKKRLWTKGEQSGNYLSLVSIAPDCDSDTLLIKAIPKGPTCHNGTDTCWGESNDENISFLTMLEKVIQSRKQNPSSESYVSSLFAKGTPKVAQKVGEEAVELVIEAMRDDDKLFLEEASDLLFHYIVLLADRGFELSDVVKILQARHK